MSVIYDFARHRDLNRWHLEGNGNLSVSENGGLVIETAFVRPDAKATTVWLRDVVLPENFRLTFSFRSDAANGNTMVIFNALPYELGDIFDDPRPDARYCDIASFRKMQAHTIGFHRGVYGRPSVLRKLGGCVPMHWGNPQYPSPEWHEMDNITAMSHAREPLTEADKGKLHSFFVTRVNDRITFTVNDVLVHDYTDALEYPYCETVLRGGRMGFRNFSGPAVDVYESIVLEVI